MGLSAASKRQLLRRTRPAYAKEALMQPKAKGGSCLRKKKKTNSPPKKWRYEASKMKDAVGETDYQKKLIKINKSDSKKYIPKSGISKQDSTIINTLAHETIHKNHPHMTEKEVRKEARRMVNSMSPKEKGRLYAKIA